MGGGFKSFSHYCRFNGTTVSVWQEEGYTVKYSLSTREMPRAEIKGFTEGSVFISSYIPTRVIIQIFSISKSYTSSIVLHGRAILEELILRIGQAAGAIFSQYCPVDEAIRVLIDPVENSVLAALGNIHGQESNTR